MTRTPLLDSSHYSTAIHVDPQLGVLCIGFHEASGRLRAVDAVTGRVGWEAPPSVTADPARRAIALSAGRVYVAHDFNLAALDLRTGALGWQVKLSAEVQTGFGRPCLADPYAGNAPGVLVAQLTDEQFVGLDRATGTWRWALSGATYFGPFAVPGAVVLNAQLDGQLRTLFVDPTRGPANLCALPCPFGLLRLAGRNVAVGSTDIDGLGHAGVSVVELPTGRVLLTALAPFQDSRGAPVFAGPYVYSADLIEFAGSPNGPRGPLGIVPEHCVDRLESTNHTLIGLFNTERGASRLRLCGFDPRTLAARYATGVDLGARPALEEGMSNLAVAGTLAVVAGASAEGTSPEVLLSVLNADTGQPLWQHRVPGRVEHVDAPAGFIRLRTDRQTLVFRATGGRPVAVFPFA